MELQDKSFTDWWKSLEPAERDTAAISLSAQCNAALSTIRAWGLGYRKPKSRSQNLIVKYLAAKGMATDSQTLFPNT